MCSSDLMRLVEPEKKLPQPILRMIISEMAKEDVDLSDWETIYENIHMDLIDDILKRFGFTDFDYEVYGFFALLYIKNHNKSENEPLDIPSLKKFSLDFRVYVRKKATEYWELDYDAYDESFVRDMFNNGDLSYYDGNMIDDDVTDQDTDDWELENITEVKKKVNEGRIKKNILLENREERQKELKELNKLKMVIEQRIRLLSP